MCYNPCMHPELSNCKNKKICVAVSGGKDSTALLHYLYTHKDEYGIALSALNCDHKIRGEASARDSAFVKRWCRARKIPLVFFEWDGERFVNEAQARLWRRECYQKALNLAFDGAGADYIATAHHANDNAETVIFNLARGSALAGVSGIRDDMKNRIIRPLINCTRAEIDAYARVNSLEYVEDESNFTEDYTRNKIRLSVLPELERAVPGAINGICRFARLAAEDEEYFAKEIEKRGLLKGVRGGYEIAFCEEKPLFARAAVKAIELMKRRDYTAGHVERLYKLQFCENGKKFEFLKLTAYKEEGKTVICDGGKKAENELPFGEYFCAGYEFCGVPVRITDEENFKRDLDNFKSAHKIKVLKFDLDAIPESAALRFFRTGDVFKKFGGGTKKAGDYFTDKKIPVRVRPQIPVIADGGEILIICGAEISDRVKITEKTKRAGYVICEDCAGNL